MEFYEKKIIIISKTINSIRIQGKSFKEQKETLEEELKNKQKKI